MTTSYLTSKDFFQEDNSSSDDELRRGSVSYLGRSVLKDSLGNSRLFLEQSERSKRERIKQVKEEGGSTCGYNKKKTCSDRKIFRPRGI